MTYLQKENIKRLYKEYKEKEIIGKWRSIIDKKTKKRKETREMVDKLSEQIKRKAREEHRRNCELVFKHFKVNDIIKVSMPHRDLFLITNIRKGKILCLWGKQNEIIYKDEIHYSVQATSYMHSFPKAYEALDTVFVDVKPLCRLSTPSLAKKSYHFSDIKKIKGMK